MAFAKYLTAEKAFQEIRIYEQRDRVGGIWNLSKPEKTKRIPLPQINPRYGQNRSASTSKGTENGVNGFEKGNGNHDDGDAESLEFESPLYDYLETNIPKPLMAYSDKPFADDLPLFPDHKDVLRYIEEYAEDVQHLISFETEVTRVTVEPNGPDGADEWTVETTDLKTRYHESAKFDAIVVANGHYTVPSVPEVRGLQQWSEAYPGSVIHSKAYRKPEDYTNKKVLVIGNSASGLDIAYQIGQKCKQPILLSSRSVSAFGTAPSADWRKDVDEVVEFVDPRQRSRAIRLASGGIESDIDIVVFCTGYFYSYPFLKDIDPPVLDGGSRILGTYKHLFNIIRPTLACPLINLKVVPFPLAENQAAVVARVWSGRLSLPSKDEMEAWERQIVQKNGDGKYFHLMKFPQDAAQMNEMQEWSRQASRHTGLENDGKGRVGMRWNERQVWLRSKFPDIKAAYQKMGEQRSQVKSVQELGFDFDKWRANASENDLVMFSEARC